MNIDLRRVFLCMKHEIALTLELRAATSSTTSSGVGVKGFKGAGPTSPRSTAGIIDTPMMDRFSGGTAGGWHAVIAQEPVGRMGKSPKSRGCCRLAVLRRGHVRHRPRDGDRWQPDGLTL
jgi:hypothetical protein